MVKKLKKFCLKNSWNFTELQHWAVLFLKQAGNLREIVIFRRSDMRHDTSSVAVKRKVKGGSDFQTKSHAPCYFTCSFYTRHVEIQHGACWNPTLGCIAWQIFMLIMIIFYTSSLLYLLSLSPFSLF